MKMNRSEIEFLEFVVKQFDLDREGISLDSKYSEIDNWDSLKMLRLIMEVESYYSVVIPIEEVQTIETLGDLFRFIKK